MLVQSPKILIVGTGAIGSLYGGKLSQAGARVSTLSRSDYDIVRQKGISVKSHWGDFVLRPEKVYRSSEKIKETFDFILVTLKVLPRIDVAGIIRKSVSPQTAIVLLQNGINIEEPLT